MGLLGMGNGSVFQLVPQRFPKEIGVMTGVVGAAGGVGGFFLPNLFGGAEMAYGELRDRLCRYSPASASCAWSAVVAQRPLGGHIRRPTLAGGRTCRPAEAVRPAAESRPHRSSAGRRPRPGDRRFQLTDGCPTAMKKRRSHDERAQAGD